MVVALGGPADLLEKPGRHLAAAPVVRPVHAEGSGHVARIATRDVGVAVVALGGGRIRPPDPIDHAVGFTELAPVGAQVDRDRPLGIVHARDEAAAEAAARALRRAYTLGDAPQTRAPLILDRIGATP
jgi:thymidine phosphorylase